jgi:hypothetical protein
MSNTLIILTVAGFLAGVFLAAFFPGMPLLLVGLIFFVALYFWLYRVFGRNKKFLFLVIIALGSFVFGVARYEYSLSHPDIFIKNLVEKPVQVSGTVVSEVDKREDKIIFVVETKKIFFYFFRRVCS